MVHDSGKQETRPLGRMGKIGGAEKKEENDVVLRRNKGEDERRRSRSRRIRLRQISGEPRNVP